MSRIVWTPRARRDIADIWRQIARHNRPAADRLVNRLARKLTLAAMHPEMGATRPELSATARILIEGRFVVIYEPMPDGVIVVAIVHGMTDPETWLD